MAPLKRKSKYMCKYSCVADLQPNQALENFGYVTGNVAVGGACFIAVTGALLAHMYRIKRNWKKDWYDFQTALS